MLLALTLERESQPEAVKICPQINAKGNGLRIFTR